MVAPSPNQKNVLRYEMSPYLLQHKDNPVWWKSWVNGTFALALNQNKPIFLSIGYSTCHWCHVMEKESFENKEIANLLNANFISIKVDREERPDVDKVYMDAIHAMGIQGGWPLSVFLTPDLKPFFGGTYFPKEHFINLLNQISLKWKSSSNQITDQASAFTKLLSEHVNTKESEIKLSDKILKLAYNKNKESFDPIYGGFANAPKFPPSMTLRFLMKLAKRNSNENEQSKLLEMIDKTLIGMFRGGIYDHIGGGFHRYSTDKKWLIPHFEKMLYDNALLATTYIEAFQLTGNEAYANIAKETLGYILRDMSAPNGGYYSAEDADSEGKEGCFYIWSYDELKKVLSKEDFARISRIYEVIPAGNFEGRSIINLIANKSPEHVFSNEIKSIRKKLFIIRAKRTHPYKDDKILTAWNGLMISAMAKGYQVFNDEKYLLSAQKSATFIKDKLDQGKKLQRRHRNGDTRFSACLADYAYLIEGLINLYESDFDTKWFLWALDLQNRQNEYLWSSRSSAYVFAKISDDLIKESVEFHDDALPNSNAVSILNLLKLYHFTYDAKFHERANLILKTQSGLISQYPFSFSQSLIALDFLLDSSKEIALIGNSDSDLTKQMLKQVRGNFYPNKVIALTNTLESKAAPPLLYSKEKINSLPTVYVCMNKKCLLPTNSIEVLKKQLSQTSIIKL